VTQLEQTLVLAQDTLAQAQGEIALGLIQVYRALGGGWQIRCTGCEPGQLPPAKAADSAEVLPSPIPEPTTKPGSPATEPGPAPREESQ
jgi:hypothetical protein